MQCSWEQWRVQASQARKGARRLGLSLVVTLGAGVMSACAPALPRLPDTARLSEGVQQVATVTPHGRQQSGRSDMSANAAAAPGNVVVVRGSLL